MFKTFTWSILAFSLITITAKAQDQINQIEMAQIVRGAHLLAQSCLANKVSRPFEFIEFTDQSSSCVAFRENAMEKFRQSNVINSLHHSPDIKLKSDDDYDVIEFESYQSNINTRQQTDSDQITGMQRTSSDTRSWAAESVRPDRADCYPGMWERR